MHNVFEPERAVLSPSPARAPMMSSTSRPNGRRALRDVVLITPCHNEYAHLDALIASVANQTLHPVEWIIVDDRSTDGSYARAVELGAAHDWIRVVRVPAPETDGAVRTFAKKARAVNYGFSVVQSTDAGVVGCLDADVVLPPDFLAVATDKFASLPRLGVTGGRFRHPVRGEMEVRVEHEAHVPGPAQLFRWEAFADMGGYPELRHGGIDTVANYLARRDGWDTRTFSDLSFTHSRQMGTGGGRTLLAAALHLGRQDYDLGTLAVFELAKVAKAMKEDPKVIGGLVRGAGYLLSAVRRVPNSTPPDIRAFIQAEQRDRLTAGIGAVFRSVAAKLGG